MTSKRFVSSLDSVGNEYHSPVTETRGYETDGKNATRDSLNALQGNLTGRNFSEYLIWRGWTIREISRLQMTRFSYDDASIIIGRDILQWGIDLDILKESINRLWDNDKFENLQMQFTTHEGIKDIIAWKTETGKRTYHGKESDGMMKYHPHAHYKNQGKRNRRLKGW